MRSFSVFTQPPASIVAVLAAALLGVAACATTEDPSLKPFLTLSDLQYDAGVIMDGAERLYSDKKWEEAAVEYERFLELHPVHRWAPHAQFKLALCYYQRMPAVGRDPAIVEKTEAAFERVLGYDDSRYADAARAKLAEVRLQLAQSDLKVGRFYLKQHKYPAAITRFKRVLDRSPGGEVAEDATYYLALAYERDGQLDQARNSLQALTDGFPETRYEKPAAKLDQRLAAHGK